MSSVVGLLVVLVILAGATLTALIILGVHIVAQIDDLNAAQAADAADLTQLATDANALVVLLQQVEQQNPGVDLTGPIAAATALGTGLTAVDAAVTTALQNPGGPNGGAPTQPATAPTPGTTRGGPLTGPQ